MELNFFGKYHAGTPSHNNVDVSINVQKTGVGVIFRNEALPVVKKGDFIKFAPHGNRLYFDISDDKTGYRLQKKQTRSTTYTCVNGIYAINVLATYAGNYPLQFDKTIKFYYIEKKEGEEGRKNEE